MKKIIDAIGKTCPIPVVETKKVLATLNEGDVVEVSVDNIIAVQNLSKMAEQKKLEMSHEKINENHYVATLTIAQKESVEKSQADQTSGCELVDANANMVVVLDSDVMGDGDEKLGRLLMKGFIYALTEQDNLPKTILLYNKGAYLSTQSSESIADLKLLESQGVEIFTCGTCLNHYGLTEQLAVGSVTNMYVIVEKQVEASKIIQP